jgi:uncharacterized protein
MTSVQDSGGERSRRFDAFALVARSGHIEGVVDPFDLERVRDDLGADEGGEIPQARIAWRLDGETDALGRAALRVTLDGEVPLQCQRCMRLFLLPVHQRNTVLLAHDDQELAYLDDNDEREVVLAAGPLDARELVEDELLLTLPYVPRCERPDCTAGEDGEARDEDEATQEPSAFEALQALRKSPPPDRE